MRKVKNPDTFRKNIDKLDNASKENNNSKRKFTPKKSIRNARNFC